MRLFVDTHALIWYVDQDHLLSSKSHAAISDPKNDLLLSAATIWEIAIKNGLGKLTLSQSYRGWIDQAIFDLRLSLLPITVENCSKQLSLPYHHGDPFDRMIIAQAMTESISIVSGDTAFDLYGVTRTW